MSFFLQVSDALVAAEHAASTLGMLQNLHGALWQQGTKEGEGMEKVKGKKRQKVHMVGRKVRMKVSSSPRYRGILFSATVRS